ncbi:50S ribosomal protein L24 [Mycoplasmopsis agassizii]|uniref:50S ribosomal protein L24 n=1 Tax=Mycoplasmopsis agassizii TaxID=33922 RepID=UPI003526F4B9
MNVKTKLRKNDDVIVIAGAYKGQRGQILNLFPKTNKATVKGINVVTKHKKPTQQDQKGGIDTFEAPIHLSNLALALNKGKNANNQTTKLRIDVRNDGKKVIRTRIAKKSGKAV